MHTRKMQVLAALVATASTSGARAQPAAPATPAAPRDQAPLDLGAWLAERGGPTTLTLKMEDATLADITDEVARQTGLSFVLDAREDHSRRFSVHARGEPFHRAIRGWDRTPDGTRLIAMLEEGAWRLRAVPASQAKFDLAGGLFFQAGPAEIVAGSIALSRDRASALGHAPGQNERRASEVLVIFASALLDPKVETQVLSSSAQFEEGVDDKGRALGPPGPSALRQDVRGLGNRLEGGRACDVALAAPAQDAGVLARVRGMLRLSVVTRRAQWEVDLRAAPVAEKTFPTNQGPVSLRIEKIDGEPGAIDVRMTRPLGAAGGGLSTLGDAVRIVDAGGQPVKGVGDSIQDRGLDGQRILTVRRALAAGQAPARVLVDLPLEWREARVPFEMKDIPLP